MSELFPSTIIRDAAEALNRPIAKAEGLPGSFFGEDFYKLEQQTLFPKSWCAVAVASVIPNPGDVLPVDLAGWQIVLIRGKDGEIRAFHNVCRHRGLKLVTEPCNAARLRCPWHSWAYGLDGALLATPELGGAGISKVDGFDKDALGLKEVRVGRWLDLVFVNIDGTAQPFEDYVAPIDALLADYNLSDLRYSVPIGGSYDGNWKIAMEGGLEDYHLTFAHPQLDAHLYRNATPCVHLGSYCGGYVDVRSEEAGEADGTGWTARLPGMHTHGGELFPRLYALTLFPTATILVTADHVMLGTLLPQGHDRTMIDIHLYYQGDAATDPRFEEARAGNLAMWNEVIPQDMPFVKAVQATALQRDAAGISTRFSPYWEAGVRGFQQMVVAAVE